MGQSAGLVRQPLFVVDVPQDGPATIAGIPIADTVVEQFRADAKFELVLVDHDREPLARSRVFTALSPKITRAVRRRDGHCRVGCCDRRHGLHTHHLWPRSWGGTDDISNLAAVCAAGGTDHHLKLVPYGPWLLLGNPNRPDGLHLVHRDDIDLDQFLRRRRPPTSDALEHILRSVRRKTGRTRAVRSAAAPRLVRSIIHTFRCPRPRATTASRG